LPQRDASLVNCMPPHDPRRLQDFTADFPPDMTGATIGNADGIRAAHNSFAAPEAHLADEQARKATEDDDVYHFVSYIHKVGAVWELDGLQPGPIMRCECSQARPALSAHAAQGSAGVHRRRRRDATWHSNCMAACALSAHEHSKREAACRTSG
jgi:Ubiquitin carboxyl-terminal hydrolase, family 1